MRNFVCLLFALGALTLISVWTAGPADAAYKPRGSCKKQLRIWSGSVGWGAFVTNRRGSYCAWSRGYKSKRIAIRKALNRCGRRKCRVVSTRRPPRVARLRNKCRRSLNQLKNKPGYRAFALSKTGDWCSWSWGAEDLADARAKALEGCKTKHRCTIYSTLVAPEVLKVRQRHLKELGLYDGKIDAIWGRGTKRAMVTFSRWADYPNSDDDTTYDMLKWAVRIVRNLGLEPKEAAKHAQRAVEEQSIAFLKQPGGSTRPDASANRDDDFRQPRDPSFVSSLGPALDSSRLWPHGIGKWVLVTDSNSSNPDKPACQLSTEGLVIAHFNQPGLRTVLITKRTDMPDGKGLATVSVARNKAIKLDVRDRERIGRHIVVSDSGSILKSLVFARFLKIDYADGKGSVSFPVAHLRQHLLPLGRCIAENGTKRIPVVLKDDKKRKSGKRGDAKDGFAQAKRNRQGQYSVLVEVNAEPIFMLVDTGAGRVAINESMAKRAGIAVKNADFKNPVTTANGITKAAYTVAKELRLGGITMRNVKVSILRDTSLASGALLGMTFLNRLKRFEFAGDRLKLYQ